MAMKNALASDSWPVTPTSSVRPMAPIAALIAKSPVCIQNAPAYCGSHSSSATSAIQAIRLDTRDLPRPEQPPRPPQQDHEQDHVRHDVAEPPAEEGELVLIAGRELLRDADDQPGHESSGNGIQAAQHRHRDRVEGQQARDVADPAGWEADEERA